MSRVVVVLTPRQIRGSVVPVEVQRSRLDRIRIYHIGDEDGIRTHACTAQCRVRTALRSSSETLTVCLTRISPTRKVACARVTPGLSALEIIAINKSI